MKKLPAAAAIAFIVLMCSCSSSGLALFLAFNPPDKGMSLTRVETAPGQFACGYWFPRSKDHTRLLVYLPGSGNQSALGYKQGGKWKALSDGWLVKDKFDDSFDVFIADKSNIEPGGNGRENEAFLRSYTLDGRVSAAVASIRAFISEHPYRDIYLMGASEGGTIAARVFIELRGTFEFRKVAVIAGNSLSQADEFGIMAENDALNMPDDYRASLKSLPEEYAKILADPESISKWWFGHAYRRWSSFLPYAPLDDLLKIDVPLYVYHGRRDISTPVEGSRALKAAFDAAGKTNLNYVEDDGDHSGFVARMGDLARWLKE
jgi:pimeloyl-ACP methyl ester carboxylesterase